MSNNTLTGRELDKVFALYADYGPERLGDFIRMIWGEAHELGRKDGYVEGHNDGKQSVLTAQQKSLEDQQAFARRYGDNG